METRVAIVGYGMGNLRSVANAFGALPVHVEIVDSPVALATATHIVLPGVGAFGDGMQSLRSGNWIAALEDEVRGKHKPFLGICLGMQLLATTGTEHGTCPGLGWIDGTVQRLDQSDPALRIPHIGWNDVAPTAAGPLFGTTVEPPCYYFVHSYALYPKDDGVVTGRCTYGSSFVAAVSTGNVHGVQFHPEKSHKEGLSLLGRFVALEAGSC